MGVMTELPGFDKKRIELEAQGWTDGGLWDDIRWLADRFWAAGGHGGKDATVAWHHLVLAVGNFKRQPGRRLRPAHLSPAPPGPVVCRPSCAIPGEAGLVVEVDGLDSWQRLMDGLPGAAVPTTTALLAALWPGEHFIFDRRVRNAAIGLRLRGGLPVPVEPTDTRGPKLTFDLYGMVRLWVTATAESTGASVVGVERALYQLDRRIPRDKGTLTWEQYTAAMQDRLGRGAHPS